MSKILRHEKEPAMPGSFVDHIEHIEDVPVLQGEDGIRQMLHYLRSINAILNCKPSEDELSIKYDGSVSIIAGWNTILGMFFVAKKSIFNKMPIFYSTEAEIDDSGLSNELKRILKDCLEWLPYTFKNGIMQGDFMFSRRDVLQERVSGFDYATIHPNTIVYATEDKMPLLRASIGIAWHTAYTGTPFSLQACPILSGPTECVEVYVFPTKYVQQVPIGYNYDARIQRLEARLLSKLGTFQAAYKNKRFRTLFKQYNNTLGRGNEKPFIRWLDDIAEADALKRKTVKGKDSARDLIRKISDFYSEIGFHEIWSLIQEIREIKLDMLFDMNMNIPLKTFVRYKNNQRRLSRTTHEGFVVKGADGRNPMKLVDRTEFSHLNFSNQVEKGWER